MAVNIVIADDHKMVREGLKCLLELDKAYNVVGEAGDGYECLNYANKTQPDIILLDINMPNLDGLQVLNIIKSQKMTLKIMRQENINKKVIMVTLYDDVDYLIKALDYKCNGYVLKNSDFSILKDAIDSVEKNEIYVEPSLTVMLNSSLARRDVKKSMIDSLTKRELEILKLIAQGLLNKEIAAMLNISERTVKNHISNIFKKIDVSDRTQAAVFAIKNGIVEIK